MAASFRDGRIFGALPEHQIRCSIIFLKPAAMAAGDGFFGEAPIATRRGVQIHLDPTSSPSSPAGSSETTPPASSSPDPAQAAVTTKTAPGDHDTIPTGGSSLQTGGCTNSSLPRVHLPRPLPDLIPPATHLSISGSPFLHQSNDDIPHIIQRSSVEAGNIRDQP
ncbi:hypothetical protein ACLOJK_039081 [Asimina triloba]